MEYRVADLEQIAKDSRSNLKKTTDTVFQSDDKLLSSLQKLGWELEQQDPEEEKTIEKLRETSMRYVTTFVSHSINTDLDVQINQDDC